MWGVLSRTGASQEPLTRLLAQCADSGPMKARYARLATASVARLHILRAHTPNSPIRRPPFAEAPPRTSPPSCRPTAPVADLAEVR